MAEAFLKVVVENVGALIKEEIGLILGVDKEMKKLCSTLTTIQAVLEDAELKQIEEPPVQDWLRKVNAVVYEIDDILDECNTQVSKLNHNGTKLSRYSLTKIRYHRKIARRMKQVTEKLDGVAAERAKFHLREIPVNWHREVAAAWRETGSLLNESDLIYGREEDREKIVKMLVEDVRERKEISVLPIIGVGGLGKTTLAQLVFNHPLVMEHFDTRIWVCVSDNFDIKTLVKAMIESATGTGNASDLQHLDTLQRRLRELLSQKRYLVVLDDVWNDQQEKWFELKNVLSGGLTGASIIVTTRLKMVAEIMGTLPAHCPKGLSEEHCWMLLQQRAFRQQEEVAPTLEIIGKQIVKKCAGVPLAAKALGGILRFKRIEKEWRYVRDSEMWELSAEESLIMPALRLSYHHLPLELRQCFAYFAAFPKDYRVKKEELIQLWMAHGFISSKGTLQVEDVGNEICNELVLRSLLQSSVDAWKGMWMTMHDLVHDLAQSVMENKIPGIQTQRNVTSSASTIRQVNLYDKTILFPKTFQQDMSISSIMELESLRVLDASCITIKDLPPSVGNLKHLRYLNLSLSDIRTLPNSLCTLWNLQILNLDYCYSLVALPKKMRYLQNLQHLCLSECDALCEMPSKMRELSNLKTLSKFIVGHNKGNRLEELQCLNLSGSLEIQHLERVRDHEDAKKANIAEKKNLRKLSLSWRRKSLSKLGEEEVDEKVLEALEPHPNLEKLSIIHFSGRYFPAWLTNSTLGKIVKIKIMNCHNCRRLPKLGELPHLKRLLLRDLVVEEYLIKEEEEEEEESGNPVKKIQFPALELLELENLPNLKGLSEEQGSKEAFPNLKRLTIKDCSSFILPPISSLQKLENLKCRSSTLALLCEVDSLTRLRVMIEEKMSCFPIGMLLKFSNLRELTIRGAKDISVRGEGLQLKALNKLESLTIEHSKTMRCIPEGLLRHLTGLQILNIYSCSELVELSEEIKHLHNLEFIKLVDLPKMVCLPEALQHLSSLGSLDLMMLPSLESLPDCLHQLTSLSVSNCAKVMSLPAAIPNLKKLFVLECPELERRCQRGSGTESEWHKIAHIPDLLIG